MINSLRLRNSIIPQINSRRSKLVLGLGIAVLFYALLGLACNFSDAANDPSGVHIPHSTHTITIKDSTLTLYHNHSFKLTWQSADQSTTTPQNGGAWLISQEGQLKID